MVWFKVERLKGDVWASKRQKKDNIINSRGACGLQGLFNALYSGILQAEDLGTCHALGPAKQGLFNAQ